MKQDASRVTRNNNYLTLSQRPYTRCNTNRIATLRRFTFLNQPVYIKKLNDMVRISAQLGLDYYINGEKLLIVTFLFFRISESANINPFTMRLAVTTREAVLITDVASVNVKCSRSI